MRYGLDGKLLDLGKDKEVPVRELIHEMIDWFLRDVIDELGTRNEIEHTYKILEGGSSTDVTDKSRFSAKLSSKLPWFWGFVTPETDFCRSRQH